MDKLAILGLIISLTGILSGQLLEGGDLSILLQGAAFLIVFGGTLGAVMLQSPLKVFTLSVKMMGWVFVTPQQSSHQELIHKITGWSSVARVDGILALEGNIAKEQDPFLQKGLQLLVDGYSADKIREVLNVDIHAWQQLRWQAASVWESAAGYSPTIGIIGAVLGLTHVMQNLSEPAKLGNGIAVAFIATIYGVSLANLLYLPVSNKLKAIITQQADMREMLVDGLVAIANGDNPRLIAIRLQSYLAA